EPASSQSLEKLGEVTMCSLSPRRVAITLLSFSTLWLNCNIYLFLCVCIILDCIWSKRGGRGRRKAFEKGDEYRAFNLLIPFPFPFSLSLLNNSCGIDF